MKINEVVNSDLLNGPHYKKTFRIGEYSYQVENVLHSGDVPGVNVVVKDPSRKYAMIAYAYFILQGGDDEWLESDETEVDDDYQGKGIASTIYSLIKMLGFSVKPSEMQTAKGRHMWNAWKAKGNDKHLAEDSKVGEYVYHASYMPNLGKGLKSVLARGLIPSTDGYAGPGVYFAYEPEGGYYHVDKDQATMFRVKWADLVALYGEYPKVQNGIQRDNEEIIVPGPVPASMLEIEYFPDEWWDIRSATSSELRSE